MDPGLPSIVIPPETLRLLLLSICTEPPRGPVGQLGLTTKLLFVIFRAPPVQLNRCGLPWVSSEPTERVPPERLTMVPPGAAAPLFQTISVLVTVMVPALTFRTPAPPAVA